MKNEEGQELRPVFEYRVGHKSEVWQERTWSDWRVAYANEYGDHHTINSDGIPARCPRQIRAGFSSDNTFLTELRPLA